MGVKDDNATRDEDPAQLRDAVAAVLQRDNASTTASTASVDSTDATPAPSPGMAPTDPIASQGLQAAGVGAGLESEPASRAGTPRASIDVNPEKEWNNIIGLVTRPDDIQARWERKVMRDIQRQQRRKANQAFRLEDLLPLIKDGFENVAEDDFTKCFESSEPDPWNWNIYLWPMWAIGVVVRHCILFPIRLTILLTGALLYTVLFSLVSAVVRNESKRHQLQRALIRMLATAFVMSWSGVIKYHGVIPPKRKNQIFVANHTSLIDMIVMLQAKSFAVVGQRHDGVVGFLQKNILQCLGSIWFERYEIKSRRGTHTRIVEHLANDSENPLLLFPEGTCVNNEYCVMFRKGAFDLGATVHPVAIKYNKVFVDGFWNSRTTSFPRHLYNLMTSWAVVCDVWFLDEQVKEEGESAMEFAQRVKTMIANQARLKDIPYDGYMKHIRPSKALVEFRRQLITARLLLNIPNPDDHGINGPAPRPTGVVPVPGPNIKRADSSASLKEYFDLHLHLHSGNNSSSLAPSPTTGAASSSARSPSLVSETLRRRSVVPPS